MFIFAKKMSILKTTLPLILLALICYSKSFSQEITTKWSEDLEFNAKSLYFNRFVGENEEYIYALYVSDTMFTGFAGAKEKKLVAISKNTLKEIKSTPLQGFSENKTIYKGLEFHTCVVQSNMIMLYWSKINSDSEELYCETFDLMLNRTSPAKVIYTNTHAFDLKRALATKNLTSFVVCQNEKRKDEVLIGTEIPIAKNYVKFEYALRLKDLELSPLKTIALPLQLDDQSFGLCSTYEYLENGDLLIRSSFTAEEGKGVTDNVARGGILITDVNPYFVISYLNVNKNEIATIELPVFDLTIYSPILKSALTNNELIFYALYSDVKKKTNEIKGLYCGKFNIEDMTSSTAYVEFEQSTIDSLFSILHSKNLLIRDVKIKDENVIIIIAGTYDFASQLNNVVAVLGYGLDNEFNWMKTINTTPMIFTNYIISAKPNEIIFFYGLPMATDSKGPKSFFGINALGYAVLDTENGELIEQKELKLDKDVRSTSLKLINNHFYFIHLNSKPMINSKTETGNFGRMIFE